MTKEELTHKWNGYRGIIIYPTDNVKELINATIEALEQEPKQGHWDKDGACPFCGYLQQWDDDNYCGHCGAKLTKINQD